MPKTAGLSAAGALAARPATAAAVTHGAAAKHLVRGRCESWEAQAGGDWDESP